MALKFVLLGPVNALVDGVVLAVGGLKPRTLLALLLLQRNRVVSPDVLADELWDETPPTSARKTLQAYMSRLGSLLRRARGSDTGPDLRAHWSGYELVVEPDQVDAHRFEVLSEAGRVAYERGEVEQAATTLRSALDLWRGAACHGALSSPAVQGEARRLEQLRLDTLELRFDADLMLGRFREVAIDLEPLLSAYPLREHLHAVRMTALYGAGRQIEALGAYQIARDMLVDGLGVEPSAELQAVQRAVLEQRSPHQLLTVLAQPA